MYPSIIQSDTGRLQPQSPPASTRYTPHSLTHSLDSAQGVGTMEYGIYHANDDLSYNYIYVYVCIFSIYSFFLLQRARVCRAFSSFYFYFFLAGAGAGVTHNGCSFSRRWNLEGRRLDGMERNRKKFWGSGVLSIDFSFFHDYDYYYSSSNDFLFRISLRQPDDRKRKCCMYVRYLCMDRTGPGWAGPSESINRSIN